MTKNSKPNSMQCQNPFLTMSRAMLAQRKWTLRSDVSYEWVNKHENTERTGIKEEAEMKALRCERGSEKKKRKKDDSQRQGKQVDYPAVPVQRAQRTKPLRSHSPGGANPWKDDRWVRKIGVDHGTFFWSSKAKFDGRKIIWCRWFGTFY